MKKAGIVGGLGPASTIDYYREIIETYRTARGDDIYPPIVVDSINMGPLVKTSCLRITATWPANYWKALAILKTPARTLPRLLQIHRISYGI